MFDPLRLSEVTSLSEVVFDSLKLEYNILSIESNSESYFYGKVRSLFEKIQQLANHLQYTFENAFIQYQQELFPDDPLSTSLSHTDVSKPSVSFPTQTLSIPSLAIVLKKSPLRTTMARFSPLVLPSQLIDLPHNYWLPLFDGTIDITTREHINKITNFIDLEEVDNDYAKMRILAQIFSGK